MNKEVHLFVFWPLSRAYEERALADMAELHPMTHVILDETDAAARGFAPEFRMRLSTSKLEALGWRPKHGLDAMFADLIADMRAQAPLG